jgi:hypothetical protein
VTRFSALDEMEHRTMKTACIAAAALALAAPFAALAASPAATTNGEVIVSGQHVVLVPNSAGKFVPPLGHKPKLKAILSNFAMSYAKGPYNAFEGVPINGPGTFQGQFAFATSFTLNANATVQEVDIAGGWTPGSSGKPIMTLHIYADASGLPGTELWSGNAVVPEFGTCCGVIVFKVKGGLALTSGTPYWLGATTGPKGTGFSGAWDLNVLDQVDTAAGAVNQGSGWVQQQEPTNFVYGLYGK